MALKLRMMVDLCMTYLYLHAHSDDLDCDFDNICDSPFLFKFCVLVEGHFNQFLVPTALFVISFPCSISVNHW